MSAWDRYRPTAANPWDLRKVGHLYRRAAFGATWAELQAGVAAGPDKAIDQLLAGGPDAPAFPGQHQEGQQRRPDSRRGGCCGCSTRRTRCARS